jgi:integrase
MTCAELAAVLAALPAIRVSERDQLLVEVLANTGCRISETLGLDWTDLGRDGKTIRIERQWYRGTLKPNTKSENGLRTISLSPALAERLWRLGADATGPMFSTRTGKRLADRNIRRVIDQAAEAAGAPKISAHSFRHTHGSILLDEGWPITEVAHRLGDDVQTVARTYAHKLPDSDRDLGFLDGLGNAEGNKRATADPQTATNV